MKDIAKQFDNCANTILSQLPFYVIPQMVNFGIKMVNEVIPSQTEFNNLTGNTFTSHAFGVYLNGQLQIGGFSKTAKPALRNKLIAGETVRNFKDYNGRTRSYFTAEVDTDAGYGKDSSWIFLNNYKPKGTYSIIFTTGIEYSAFLENVLSLNVLTDAYEQSKDRFLRSFKVVDLSIKQ